MVNSIEFSFWRICAQAWFSAWRFFSSWRRDIGVGLFSVVVGETIFYQSHGWPETVGDGMDNLIHIAAPAVALWLLLFIWHFFLAPFSIVYEAVKSAANSAAPATNTEKPVKRGLADADTEHLAGKLQRLGEVARQPRFTAPDQYSVEEMYFNDVEKSAHVIWTHPDARQLRRDFIAEIHKIVAAVKAKNETERLAAVEEMDKTIAALAKILLGQD